MSPLAQEPHQCIQIVFFSTLLSTCDLFYLNSFVLPMEFQLSSRNSNSNTWQALVHPTCLFMSVFKSRKERDVFKLLTSSYFTSIDVKKSNGKIDLYENLPATFAPKILVQTVYIFFPFDELGDERVFFMYWFCMTVAGRQQPQVQQISTNTKCS